MIRRLRRPPTSSSFPSGHTASAAAFATGVVLERPRLALPVGALAFGVGLSRVVTGVHYPSDVVAGAAIGVAAGLGTTRWWPTASPVPADAPDAARALPALPTGDGVIIVVNLAARGADGALADRLREELPQARLLVATDGAEAGKTLTEAARDARVLGVAGGDGTVNRAARLASEHGIPLLVLPAGTFDHFARDLGVEEHDQVLEALRSGQGVEVDTGLVNGDVFLNTFSIGAYVDLVRAREKYEARLGKWPATMLGAFGVLRRGRHITVRVNGEPRRIWLLFAGNCRYEPAGLAPSYRPRLADGDLDVRIVGADRPLARLRLLVALGTGTLATCPVYQYRSASSLSLESIDGGPLHYTVDGETALGASRLELRKLTGKVAIYRPAGPAHPPRGTGSAP